jgi:hypothetical protein
VYIGAMLEEVPKEGEGLKIMGSAMMAHAATKEEVLEVIKQDIYFKSNVWNLDKVRLLYLYLRNRVNIDRSCRSKSTQ